ncbi:hypothetical protein FC17_GL000513 [Secundilactobacillus paracollinoides DSM 15502 = JCM 11969]|nr:hypothetical protein FC17_GL000513 [Secundilactobacillus paracollinoides DSM 15502 = JCM 11969]
MEILKLATEHLISKKTQLIAWIIVFGAMAPMLDTTMINIALNHLSHTFHSSLTTVQWTVTCYLLATGIAIPFSSWLLSKFDGKTLFIFSEALFGIGSLLAAVSPNVHFLIAMRVIQGFADGLITPLLINLIVQLAGSDVIGQLMATVGLPIILGPLLGPVIGGIILKMLSWHWLFLVNVPITFISVMLIWVKMPSFPPKKKSEKLDLVGIGVLVLLSSSMIYGIVEASTKGTFSNTITVTAITFGVAMEIIYVIWAIVRRNKVVLPLTLFKFHSFTGASIGIFISGLFLNGAMLLLPLYFQNVRHMSVIAAALALLPQGISMLISRPFVGRLTDTIGAKYVAMVSIIIIFLGTIPFFWFTQKTSYWVIAAVLFIRGFGAGGVTMPLMADSYTGMSDAQVPAATIGSRIIQNIGGAFGSALITTLVTAYANKRVKRFETSL